MSSVATKITISLDSTLTTIDNGYYKNSKPKCLLPAYGEKTILFFLNVLRKISKYTLKKSLENGFGDF